MQCVCEIGKCEIRKGRNTKNEFNNQNKSWNYNDSSQNYRQYYEAKILYSVLRNFYFDE